MSEVIAELIKPGRRKRRIVAIAYFVGITRDDTEQGAGGQFKSFTSGLTLTMHPMTGALRRENTR